MADSERCYLWVQEPSERILALVGQRQVTALVRSDLVVEDAQYIVAIPFGFGWADPGHVE